MDKAQTAKGAWRKVFRIAVYMLGSLLLLILLALLALTLPPVQQRITREAQSFLQEKLHTRVEIASIGLRFPYYIALKGLLLEDQQQDILIRIGNLAVSLDMWKLIDRSIVVRDFRLEDASIYLHQKDSINNYDFIVNAFSNPNADKSPTPAGNPWTIALDLATIRIQNVHFLMQNADSGTTTRADIGWMETVLQKSDLDKLDFQLG